MIGRRKLGGEGLEFALSDDDLRTLEEIAPPGVAAGERYPEQQMGMLNR